MDQRDNKLQAGDVSEKHTAESPKENFPQTDQATKICRQNALRQNKKETRK
jgi:hypothetical protein